MHKDKSGEVTFLDDPLEEPEGAEKAVAEDFIVPNTIEDEEAGPSHRIDSAPSEPHTIQAEPELHTTARRRDSVGCMVWQRD
ncbi:UNVERIFIED_CONTAM: hypothetical protein K2H54_004727 [Gekko kuhli]